MNSRRRALSALLLAAGCGAPPAASPPSTTVAAPAAPSACERAAALRARAAGLVEEARFFRAQRALGAADALCPADAPAGWATALAVYRALEQRDAARGLIATIQSAARVPDEAREAAVAWEREPATPPPPLDAERVATLSRDAEAAFGKKDWARAATLFGEASPQQPALGLMQGVSLLRAGQARAGNLAIERAAAQLATSSAQSFALHEALGVIELRAISPADGTVFLTHAGGISIFDPRSQREAWLLDTVSASDPSQPPASMPPVHSLEVAPGGQTLAAISPSMIRFFNRTPDGWVESAALFKSISAAHLRFRGDSLLAADDGSYFAWRGGVGADWNGAEAAAILSARDATFSAGYYEPGQGFLLTSPTRDWVRLVPGAVGGTSRDLRPKGPILSPTALSPQEQRVALTTSQGYSLLDVRTGRTLWTRRDLPRGLHFIDEQRLLVETYDASKVPETGVSGAPEMGVGEAPGMGTSGGETNKLKRHVAETSRGKTTLELEPDVMLSDQPFPYQNRDAQTLDRLSPAFESWDLTTGKLKRVAAHPCTNNATLALLPGGEPVCLEAEREGIVLHHAMTGERRLVQPYSLVLTARAVLSEKADALAVLDQTGVMHHFGLRDGSWRAHRDGESEYANAHWSNGARVSLSPQGDGVAWVLQGQAGKTRLLAARLGEAARSVEFFGDVASLSVAGDSLLACQRSQRPVLGFTFPALEPRPDVERLPDRDPPTRCSLGRDGKLMACSLVFGEVTIHEVATGRRVQTLRAAPAVNGVDSGESRTSVDTVLSLSFSRNGKVLISSNSFEVHVWDLERSEHTVIVPPAPGRYPTPVVSPDGSRVALHTHDGRFSVYSAPWGTPIASVSSLAMPIFFDQQRAIMLARDQLLSIDETGRVSRRKVPDFPLANGLVSHASQAGLLVANLQERVVLLDERAGEVRATLRLLQGGKGWYATTPDGFFDWGGDAEAIRSVLTCRLDRRILPLEACQERLRIPGMLTQIARGERPTLDPSGP